MPRLLPALALALLAACTPTYNWRELSIEPTGLRVTFPCKPEHVEHRAQLAPGREIVLHATGCEAGGAAFLVVWGDVGTGTEVAATLAQWKKASLATTKGTVEREQPYQPPGALGLPDSALVRTRGQRSDGSALQSQSAYFARGTRVFQVVVHSARLTPEMTEPFFAGLRLE